jgi:tetratricopeptide (TPR) repeat protein
MDSQTNDRPTSSELEVMLILAQTAEANGHHATAFELFRHVFASDPTVVRAAYRAARNLLDIGRISEAETFLNRVTEPGAKTWLVELLRGDLRMAQFKPADAEQHYRNAWRLNAKSTAPAVMLADCLMKQEKFDGAHSVLLEALNAQGDLEEVYLNLGLVERAKGEYPKAKFWFLKALEMVPQYASAKQALADVEAWLTRSDPQKQNAAPR